MFRVDMSTDSWSICSSVTSVSVKNVGGASVRYLSTVDVCNFRYFKKQITLTATLK